MSQKLRAMTRGQIILQRSLARAKDGNTVDHRPDHRSECQEPTDLQGKEDNIQPDVMYTAAEPGPEEPMEATDFEDILDIAPPIKNINPVEDLGSQKVPSFEKEDNIQSAVEAGPEEPMTAINFEDVLDIAPPMKNINPVEDLGAQNVPSFDGDNIQKTTAQQLFSTMLSPQCNPIYDYEPDDHINDLCLMDCGTSDVNNEVSLIDDVCYNELSLMEDTSTEEKAVDEIIIMGCSRTAGLRYSVDLMPSDEFSPDNQSMPFLVITIDIKY